MIDHRRPSEQQVREQLASILEDVDEPYAWATGEVEFELDSGEVVHGTLRRLEADSAIIAGPRGLQSVVLKNVRCVSAWMESPGPE